MRVGVLISGRGSNLEALLRAFPAGHPTVHICWVGTNRPACAGLQYARAAGLPAEVFPLSAAYADRQAQQTAISRALQREGVQLVVLAGFDQIVTAPLLEPFEGTRHQHPPFPVARFWRHAACSGRSPCIRCKGERLHGTLCQRRYRRRADYRSGHGARLRYGYRGEPDGSHTRARAQAVTGCSEVDRRRSRKRPGPAGADFGGGCE